MKAISLLGSGGVDVMRFAEVSEPAPILIREIPGLARKELRAEISGLKKVAKTYRI
jgi:hypothetical protein